MFAVFLWAGNSTAFCNIHEQEEHYVVLKSWQEPIILGWWLMVPIELAACILSPYLSLFLFAQYFGLWGPKCSLHGLPCPLTTTLINFFGACSSTQVQPSTNVTTADDTLWERRSWDRHDSKWQISVQI
jgi:hypothetical protein